MQVIQYLTKYIKAQPIGIPHYIGTKQIYHNSVHGTFKYRLKTLTKKVNLISQILNITDAYNLK